MTPAAHAACLALSGLAALASIAEAATCAVPTASYPTLAAALADPTCDPIQIAAGTLVESPAIARDVTLQGAGSSSTTVAGWVSVSGTTTDVSLNGLRIDATAASGALCHASGLDARGGARVAGLDLVVVGRPTPTAACGFLADGFESGDLAAWPGRRP